MTRSAILSFALPLLFATSLLAQGGEVTPFIAWQEGGEITVGDGPGDVEGSAAGGLFLSFDRGRGRILDLVFSRQQTEALNDDFFQPQWAELAIDYAHVGGRYLFTPERRLSPYIALTLGATHFDLEHGDALAFSTAAGAGADLRISERVALRLDGRFWMTFVDASGEIGCGGDGGSGTCTAFADSAGFSQFSLSTGVVVRY